MNVAARIVAAGLLAATTTLSVGAETSTLSVCLPSDDAPRSDRDRSSGLDVDVARLLANELGRPLQLVWLPELGEIDEVSDFNFRPLLAGACDIHLSVPGVEGLGAFRRALSLSIPYYGAAYELIPETAAWRWGSQPPGTIAVMANSIAHIAIDAAGLPWSMRPRTEDIARAVATGEATIGLVWGPDLSVLDVSRAAAFAPPPVLRWNLHAATRLDSPLVQEVNRVFGEPDFASRVSAILEHHRVPARPPFESVYSPGALRAIETH